MHVMGQFISVAFDLRVPYKSNRLLPEILYMQRVSLNYSNRDNYVSIAMKIPRRILRYIIMIGLYTLEFAVSDRTSDSIRYLCFEDSTRTQIISRHLKSTSIVPSFAGKHIINKSAK